MEYTVSNISYDTDGEQIDLPEELKILVPDNCEDVEEFISNEISNQTGFCHFGFSVTPEIG